jgi:hypothetical protein
MKFTNVNSVNEINDRKTIAVIATLKTLMNELPRFVMLFKGMA